MQFFRYRSDRLPTLIITVLFLLDLLVFFAVSNPWIVCGWMVLGLGPKACICSWNHHHQHVSTFRQTWANRLLEIVLQFLVPPSGDPNREIKSQSPETAP